MLRHCVLVETPVKMQGDKTLGELRLQIGTWLALGMSCDPLLNKVHKVIPPTLYQFIEAYDYVEIGEPSEWARIPYRGCEDSSIKEF